MKIKEGVAAAFDGACVKKATELAVPKEEADTGDMGMAIDYFFGMQVELDIEAIEFRESEYGDQECGKIPAYIAELFPFFPGDPIDNKACADGDQQIRAFCHEGAGGEEGADQQVK